MSHHHHHQQHPYYQNSNHHHQQQQQQQSQYYPESYINYDACIPPPIIPAPLTPNSYPPPPPLLRYNNGHESHYSITNGSIVGGGVGGSGGGGGGGGGCVTVSIYDTLHSQPSQQPQNYSYHHHQQPPQSYHILAPTQSNQSTSQFGSELSHLASRSTNINNNNNNTTTFTTTLSSRQQPPPPPTLTTTSSLTATTQPLSVQQPPPQYNSSIVNVTSNTANTLTSVSTSQATATAPTMSYMPPSINYLSEIEAAILRSSVPINLNETEEITVHGNRGIWANRAEVVNWRGIVPINEYTINEDSTPEIITKRADQTLTYIQELAVRYLRPPTPPPPGEIIITQEINSLTPPAPPLIIRQQPPRPSTPEPLVIREAPPPPPSQVGRKVITISGKRLPPPPRKVIIERLAPLPSKPQAVLIERWLPYSQVKRRVIFQRANERDPVIMKPRNVIVQWEAPQVVIKKDFKYLGIIRANPVEYVQRYGSTLKNPRELPDFVLDIKPPAGVVLAADYQYNQVHELEGDLQAMRLVDLDREGLSEYRAQLQRLGINYLGPAGIQKAEMLMSAITGAAASAQTSSSQANSHQSYPNLASPGGTIYSSPPPMSYGNGANNVAAHFQQQASFMSSPPHTVMTAATTTPYLTSLTSQQSQYCPVLPGSNSGSGYGSPNIYPRIHHSGSIVSELFSQIDRSMSGRISVDEAEKLLLKLNSRLGRRYTEDDIKQFFISFDTNQDGTIDLQEFRAAFERVL